MGHILEHKLIIKHRQVAVIHFTELVHLFRDKAVLLNNFLFDFFKKHVDSFAFLSPDLLERC